MLNTKSFGQGVLRLANRLDGGADRVSVRSSWSGRGQATQSGQRFNVPLESGAARPDSNLAMKVMAPFTVSSVGDVMVKRTRASLEAPEFQADLQTDQGRRRHLPATWKATSRTWIIRRPAARG